MRQSIWWITGIVFVGAGAWWLLRPSAPQVQRSEDRGGIASEPTPVTSISTGIAVRSLPVNRPAVALVAAVSNQPSFARFKDTTASFVLSAGVRQVVGLGERADNWDERAKALGRLTKNLSRDDMKALLLFCDLRYNDYTNVPIRVFNAVKNDVMALLLRQDGVPREVAGRLVSMYRDHDHDEVWRDYCIQYWAQAYAILWGEHGAGRPEDPERTEIQAGFTEALRENQGTLAGTALLGLERLSAKYANDFDRNVVISNALMLATGPSTSEATRLTALRMCAKLGLKDAVAQARELAQTGGSETLRMAAIATVGDLGGQEDMELIKALSSEPRLAGVCSNALVKLQRVAP